MAEERGNLKLNFVAERLQKNFDADENIPPDYVSILFCDKLKPSAAARMRYLT